MSLAIIENNQVRELSPGTEIVFPDATSALYEVVEGWTEAERNAKSCFTVVEDNSVVPARSRIASTSLQIVNGVPTRVRVLEDMPLPDRQAFLTSSVLALREQKLSAGFDFDFATITANDPRGVHRIATSDADMEKWREVTDAANAQIALGDATPTTIFTQTGDCDVTPLEWCRILIAAKAFRQPVYKQSFALQVQIGTAADHDALDAIDINAGW